MGNYVYIQSEKTLWTVGFYDPEGKWHSESDWDSREEAVNRVHYLNGGQDEANLKADTVVLKMKPIGRDGYREIREKLSNFVLQNFDLLYEGACRLGYNIPEDYWAPRRVQINNTRLHEIDGLKIADGHHIRSEHSPSEEQLRKASSDIQELLDVAAEDIMPPFQIRIIDNNRIDN